MQSIPFMVILTPLNPIFIAMCASISLPENALYKVFVSISAFSHSIPKFETKVGWWWMRIDSSKALSAPLKTIYGWVFFGKFRCVEHYEKYLRNMPTGHELKVDR